MKYFESSYPHQKKVVWITGASGGLGAALALTFAKHNHTLILSGRNTEKLTNTALMCIEVGAIVHIVPFDITNNQGIIHAVDTVRNLTKTIDILINNCGIGQRSYAIETNETVENEMMQTNFSGPVYLTKLALQLMPEHKGSQIIVINSISGLFGFPLRSAYCASKAALGMYFESLAFELLPKGIHIVAIYPGRLKSEFSVSARTSDGSLFNTMDNAHTKGVMLLVAAQKIYRAAQKRKPMLIFGGKETLLVYIKRLWPWLFRTIVSKLKHNS